MWRTVRFTLIWLFAVALPLQGLAAATMLGCGGHQERHSTPGAADHAHGVAAEHVHSKMADATSHDHAAVDPSQPGKAGVQKGVQQKCGACASCCTSAVVPTPTLSFDPVMLTDFFAPPVARTFAALATEGLERPPRLFLA